MNAAAPNQVTSVSRTEPFTGPPAYPGSSSATPVKRRGKPSQYWLHDEDRRALRNLAAWLAGQGERPTDSLVIRAVLQLAAAGPDLLKAYRCAAQMDGRLKPREAHETWPQPAHLDPAENLVSLPNVPRPRGST